MRIRDGNKCQICCANLVKGKSEADHVIPHSKGGFTNNLNGQMLCASCNRQKGNKMPLELRNWQKEAKSKCIKHFEQSTDKFFIINAAPGAGKTKAAIAIAQKLIANERVDRVFVVAPRREVVNQWSKDFENLTGRKMLKITGNTVEFSSSGIDLCCTWSALTGVEMALKNLCKSAKTLVICDEHHHAAENATWGTAANKAFLGATYTLLLTGTPVRSDGEKMVWVQNDEIIASSVGENEYRLSYGEAVSLGYCRPVTFHRKYGRFSVRMPDDKIVIVDSNSDTNIEFKSKLHGLNTDLNYYKLAIAPSYKSSASTPDENGYHASLLRLANEKLIEERKHLKRAGGLIIVPNIKMAEYYKQLIELVLKEQPVIVHSEEANSAEKIDFFRNADKKWLVSVAMISEGVDIPRLRVLLYLPNAQTELVFRQSVGRVVRNYGTKDISSGHVIMPKYKIFEEFALRVEREMRHYQKPTSAKAPNLFQQKRKRLYSTSEDKNCPDCNYINTKQSSRCDNCSLEFDALYDVELLNASRQGVIASGYDITEEEAKKAEKFAPMFKAAILESGDQNLMNLISKIPPAATARLVAIIQDNLEV